MLSRHDEREDELAWFGVTVEIEPRASIREPDGLVRVPALVRLDGSGRSLRGKVQLEVLVLPAEGTSQRETRRRAIVEARALAKLFLRLTEPEEE